MIGIKVISNTHMSNFEENVEKLLTEHPDAKVIFGAIKGIEGGKGLVVVFSYEKKEAPIKEPIPLHIDTVSDDAWVETSNETAEQLARDKAIAKENAEKAAKKAELEAQLKAIT